MTEAILIEIAQRRRKLEEAIEAADLFLASFKEAAERKIERAEAAHSAGTISYGTYCERVNEPHADLLKLSEVREDIERCAEACRDDMNAMADWIRIAKEPR